MIMLKHISMEKEKIKTEIKKRAHKLGFDLVGFSSVKLSIGNIAAYKKWLEKGMNAEMGYMNKAAARKNIEEILPGAKTVISVAINYYHAQPPLCKGEGRIARYAFGCDYHKIIGKKLKKLKKFIETLPARADIDSDTRSLLARARSYVDTGPILERAYAQKAGLGFVGKNSCLITKEFGSWIFLGEIITDLEIEPFKTTSQNLPKHAQFATNSHESQNGFIEPKNTPQDLRAQTSSSGHLPAYKPSATSTSVPGHNPFPGCGTCRKCIDSCPTKAIIAPGVINANRCISYLTIENKKPIPKSLAKIIKKSRRLFGCDICQEICPHNCRACETSHKEFMEPRLAGNAINLKNLIKIKSDKEFLSHFTGSPLIRAKRAGLIRNAKIFT